MLNLINELGPDRNKKETSSHLRSVRNSYVTIYGTMQSVTACYLKHIPKCMYKLKHSLANLQDLIPTFWLLLSLIHSIPAKVGIKPCRCMC